MSDYRSLRSLSRQYKLIGILGVLAGSIYTLRLALIYLPEDVSDVAGLIESIIALAVGIFLTWFLVVGLFAVGDLIKLLIRIEKNTRGISDLNNTLKQQATQRSIQTAPNPQVPNKPTLNVPEQ